MGSSFMSQIPTVLDLLQQIHAKSMFDVGKGFGKYGLLVHEYFGIPTAVRPDPGRMLREQSTVVIDAVESNPFYMWPPWIIFTARSMWGEWGNYSNNSRTMILF
jgi:hypothetical protein